jgi:hypothetical protein
MKDLDDFMNVEVNWDESAPEDKIIANAKKPGTWLCRDHETLLRLARERGVTIGMIQ